MSEPIMTETGGGISQWHHAPLHVFIPGLVYMVTAGTLRKEHVFRGDEKLKALGGALLTATAAYGWELRAWVVFSNHYHFVAKAPNAENRLGLLIKRLHSDAARAANRLDNAPGRQVWHQYWDKCLTFERSYLARLKYVTHNAVHHGIAPTADAYPYSSAGGLNPPEWAGFRRKMESFGCDQVNEPDDFSPIWP
jgi:putative transposase